MKTKIWVMFQQYGFHYYPNAPEDVAYLRAKHRHIFKYKVTMEVFHDDREIEFHQLQNFCLNLFDSKQLEADSQSCEMLAKNLLDILVSVYGNSTMSWGHEAKIKTRFIEVEVSEDGECGAIVSYK